MIVNLTPAEVKLIYEALEERYDGVLSDEGVYTALQVKHKLLPLRAIWQDAEVI